MWEVQQVARRHCRAQCCRLGFCPATSDTPVMTLMTKPEQVLGKSPNKSTSHWMPVAMMIVSGSSAALFPCEPFHCSVALVKDASAPMRRLGLHGRTSELLSFFVVSKPLLRWFSDFAFGNWMPSVHTPYHAQVSVARLSWEMILFTEAPGCGSFTPSTDWGHSPKRLERKDLQDWCQNH